MTQTIKGNTYQYDDTTKTKTITITSSNSESTTIDCRNGPGPVLTSQHTCHVICNDNNEAKMTELQYGASGTCEMKGNAQHCWKDGIINATGCDNFLWDTEYKTAEGCTMHLPYQGNATIYANGKSDGVLKKTILRSHETNFIDITCRDNSGSNDWWKDECKGLQVHAEDAQFLKLTLIDVDYQTEGASPSQIYCPQNSNISPACIIDASQAETVADLDIYALKGTPQDLMYIGNDGTAGTVALHCLNGWSAGSSITGATDTFDSGDCYITLNPTDSPTVMPTTSTPTTGTPTTTEPSISPSKYPSKSPTKTPTYNPSITPTRAPSKSPTIYSKSPTLRPTDPDVVIRHYEPSRSPIIGGGHVYISTLLPTVAGLNKVVEGGGIDTIGIIAVILSVLVCCLCVFGIFGLWKYQSLRAEKDSEIIRMQSNIKHHKMNGFVSMNSGSHMDGDVTTTDGHRTTQTSPWMIPGQYREAAYSTTIELGSLMNEGAANENNIVEEGAGGNTKHMDLEEENDSNSTPNGDTMDGDDHDVIGGIATPMGDMGDDIINENTCNNEYDMDNDIINDVNAVQTLGGDDEGDDIINEEDEDDIIDVVGAIVTPMNENVGIEESVSNDDELIKNVNKTIGNEYDNDNMDGDDSLLIDDENDITIMDEQQAKRKEKQKREQFGQILGDEVYAQDIVMDDIINEIETSQSNDNDDDIDIDDDDQILNGVDTLQ